MHEALAPGFHELIDVDAPVEEIGRGFHFTEGPAWDAVEGQLLFSDIPDSIVRSWHPERGVRPWREPSDMANGLVFDREGRLLACEAATSRITRTDRDGSVEVVASHWQGRELNSPNDVVVRSDGSIWFTDPPSGRSRPHGLPRPRQLDFQGVFRVPPGGGEPELVVGDFAIPNGLCFSPDESTLYVNDSIRRHVRAFAVQADGSLEGGEAVSSQGPPIEDVQELVDSLVERGELPYGIPDGMMCDERGSIWCTGLGGIWVVSPAGEHLGTVRFPAIPSNLAWGEADNRTLFVTTPRAVYRVRTRIAGAPLPAFTRTGDPR